MKTINSAMTGQATPVVKEMNVTPLIHSGRQIKNGHGETVMNDRWIYVNDGRGMYSINVVRSEYCRMIQLMNTTVHESIGYKRATKRLEEFINKVSDKLVFEFQGKKYRVFLRKRRNGYFDIDYIQPYYASTAIGCNKDIGGDYINTPKYAFQIKMDYRQFIK